MLFALEAKEMVFIWPEKVVIEMEGKALDIGKTHTNFKRYFFIFLPFKVIHMARKMVVEIEKKGLDIGKTDTNRLLIHACT